MGAGRVEADLQGGCSSGTCHWIIVVLIFLHVGEVLTQDLQRILYCRDWTGSLHSAYIILVTIPWGWLLFLHHILRQVRLWDDKYGSCPTLFLMVLRLPGTEPFKFFKITDMYLGPWKSRNRISIRYLTNNMTPSRKWPVGCLLIFPFRLVCLLSWELLHTQSFWVLVT